MLSTCHLAERRSEKSIPRENQIARQNNFFVRLEVTILLVSHVFHDLDHGFHPTWIPFEFLPFLGLLDGVEIVSDQLD